MISQAYRVLLHKRLLNQYFFLFYLAAISLCCCTPTGGFDALCSGLLCIWILAKCLFSFTQEETPRCVMREMRLFWLQNGSIMLPLAAVTQRVFWDSLLHVKSCLSVCGDDVIFFLRRSGHNSSIFHDLWCLILTALMNYSTGVDFTAVYDSRNIFLIQMLGWDT